VTRHLACRSVTPTSGCGEPEQRRLALLAPPPRALNRITLGPALSGHDMVSL